MNPRSGRAGGAPALALLAVALTLVPARAGEPAGRDFTSFSLEELMRTEVTSVSKKAERLEDTPAAIYVITAEDIRRSGATSLPELLRMVPGLEVSRTGSHTWEISARASATRWRTSSSC